jgi:hypothetical protein
MEQESFRTQRVERVQPTDRKRLRQHFSLRQSPERWHDAFVNLDHDPSNEQRGQMVGRGPAVVGPLTKTSFEELTAQGRAERRIAVEIEIPRRSLEW